MGDISENVFFFCLFVSDDQIKRTFEQCGGEAPSLQHFSLFSLLRVMRSETKSVRCPMLHMKLSSLSLH